MSLLVGRAFLVLKSQASQGNPALLMPNNSKRDPISNRVGIVWPPMAPVSTRLGVNYDPCGGDFLAVF